MYIHHIGTENSILNNFITELRDENIQKDSMRFRRNIERVGEILCYEMSKTIEYKNKEINTPLGIKKVGVIDDSIAICSVLRAGLPLHQGVLNYFDKAESSFISAYRHHVNDTNFEIVVEYLAAPSLENKIVVLVDPMLATGQSLVAVYNTIKSLGTPKEIHLIAVIGAQEGVSYIKNHFPENTHLWIAAIDDKLNEKGYIIPGLGDAGDLAYGSKLQQ